MEKILSNMYKVKQFNNKTHLIYKYEILIFPPYNDIHNRQKQIIPKIYFYNFYNKKYYYIYNNINPNPNKYIRVIDY